MKTSKRVPGSPLLAVTIMLGVLIPLIPALPEVFSLVGRAKEMTSKAIWKEGFVITSYYVGLLLFFISSIPITKNKIKEADILLLLTTFFLLLAGSIQIFGLARSATYNPSQVFLLAELPLLVIVYLNKRTGLKAWGPIYTWSIIFLIVIAIAFVWLGTKIGWNKYSELYGINYSGQSYAVVDAGTVLLFLSGLITLTVGVGISKRLTSGLNITSWVGLIISIFLPIIYALCHVEIKSALIQVMSWWPIWGAATALFVFAVCGFMTGPWNKDFVLPKGDEVKEDEESAASSNWNNY